MAGGQAVLLVLLCLTSATCLSDDEERTSHTGFLRNMLSRKQGVLSPVRSSVGLFETPVEEGFATEPEPLPLPGGREDPELPEPSENSSNGKTEESPVVSPEQRRVEQSKVYDKKGAAPYQPLTHIYDNSFPTEPDPLPVSGGGRHLTEIRAKAGRHGNDGRLKVQRMNDDISSRNVGGHELESKMDAPVLVSWKKPSVEGVAPPARPGQTVTRLREDGEIFVVGGCEEPDRICSMGVSILIAIGGPNNSTSRRQVEWTSPDSAGTAAPEGREGHSAVVLQHIVGEETVSDLFVFGGRLQSGEVCNEIQVLDAFSAAWRPPPDILGDMPAPREGHAAVAVHGRMFVIGGFDDDQYFNDVWYYDPDAVEWFVPHVGGLGPTGLKGHTAVVFRNSIYVFGGFREDEGASSAKLHVLNVDTMQWSTARQSGHVPSIREDHHASALGNLMYVFGGCRHPENVCYNDVHVLDLANSTWSKPEVEGTAPPPREQGRAVLIGTGSSDHRGAPTLVLLGGCGYHGGRRHCDEDVYELDVAPCVPECGRCHDCVGGVCLARNTSASCVEDGSLPETLEAVAAAGSGCHGCSGHGNCTSAGACNCENGYLGVFCEVSPCSLNCSGHGHCLAETGDCLCESGYGGPECAQEATHSFDCSCSGHGRCIHENTTVCSCYQGYSGDYCQDNFVECGNNCTSNGICTAGMCFCFPGYTGPDCSMALLCPTNCTGHGICRYAECFCDPGYLGMDCSVNVYGAAGEQGARQPSLEGMLCANETCSGHGRCTSADQCICNDGYTGAFCDVAPASCPNGCGGTIHGRCVNGTCVCSAEFDGPNCNEQARRVPLIFTFSHSSNRSDADQHDNHRIISHLVDTLALILKIRVSSLKIVSSGNWSMPAHTMITKMPVRSALLLRSMSAHGDRNLASLGISDVYEQINSDCGHDCYDNGRCIEGACDCFEGFAGIACNETYTPMCPRNCTGNGICNNGVCECNPGYFGPECVAHECPGNCSMKGVCHMGKCFCHPGYTGRNCSSEQACAADCSDHGVCRLGMCFCNPGYTGKDCSEEMTCGKAGCSDQGVCHNGQCYCYPGFTGESCESEMACLNDCSGRGKCVTGECVCETGYGSIDCSIEPMQWVVVPTNGTAPEPRVAPTSVVSPGHRTLVVFGGCRPSWAGELSTRGGSVEEDSEEDRGPPCFNDIYFLHLDKNIWERNEGKGTLPSARGGHSATLVDNDMYVIGGYDGVEYMDGVHVMDIRLVEWSFVPVNASGHGPSPRHSHSGVYLRTKASASANRRRGSRGDGGLYDGIIVFGGMSSRGLMNDWWFLDLSQMPGSQASWNALRSSVPRPGPRYGQSLVRLADGRLLMYGGCSMKQCHDDTWRCDIDNRIVRCERPPVSGTPPEPRQFHTAALSGAIMYVTGGCDTERSLCYEGISGLNTQTWKWSQLQLRSDVQVMGSKGDLAPADQHMREAYAAEWVTVTLVRDTLYMMGGCSKAGEASGAKAVCANDVHELLLEPLQCPEDCSGHGRCESEGRCKCLAGYSGDTCATLAKLNVDTASKSEKNSWTSVFLTIGLICITGITAGLGAMLYSERMKKRRFQNIIDGSTFNPKRDGLFATNDVVFGGFGGTSGGGERRKSLLDSVSVFAARTAKGW